MIAPKAVFSAIASNGLTAKPNKVFVGFQEIVFVGHIIVHGALKPENIKISQIISLSTPRTKQTKKKKSKSIIGLLNYYRKFVPNFASVAAPLASLTGKGYPNKVIWTEECQSALYNLQKVISSKPELILPDFTQTFTLRTDASDVAIGGCLLQ